MMATAPLATRLDGEPVEQQIALDMVKRSLPFIPFVLVFSAIFWGRDGAISASIAVALVLVNFVAAAAALSWTARISINAMMAAALFGYLFRLALIAGVVIAVRDQPWFEPVPLGITLVFTHMGLLLWELRHVSISFSHSGVRPPKEKRSSKKPVSKTVTTPSRSEL